MRAVSAGCVAARRRMAAATPAARATAASHCPRDCVARRVMARCTMAGGPSAAGAVVAIPAMIGRVMARVPRGGVVPRLMMARRGVLRMVLVMGVVAVPLVMRVVRAAVDMAVIPVPVTGC